MHPEGHNLIKLRAPAVQPSEVCGRRGRRGSGHWGGWGHGRGKQHCGSRAKWWRQDEGTESLDLKAELLQAKSLVDDKPVAGGQTLVKTWEIVNNGAIPWPQGTKLVYRKGDLASTENEYEVPNALPGQSVDISAIVQTAHSAGRYKALFRLCEPSGKYFGPKLWCDIVVNTDSALPEQAVSRRYERELQKLASMGFPQEELNVSLLDQHGGDVAKVCVFLLEQMK